MSGARKLLFSSTAPGCDPAANLAMMDEAGLSSMSVRRSCLPMPTVSLAGEQGVWKVPRMSRFPRWEDKLSKLPIALLVAVKREGKL